MWMRFLLVFLIILFIAPLAFCAKECIGSRTAKKFIVYLHGMDTESPNSLELKNRLVLEKLSKKINIRFALPRATGKCPTSPKQLCWTWAAKTSGDISSVETAIKSAASQCFPKKDYTVLGFSNGGVAVTAILRLCEKVDFKSAIVVGAAGGWFSTDPKTLEGCGPKVISMLGSEDLANQKPVRDFVAHLVSLKASISLVEYKGSHSLMFEPLAVLLK